MIIVVILGVGVTILGISSLLKHIKFMKNAQEAIGSITDIRKEERKETDEDGFTSKYSVYVPVISFNVDGKDYSFKSSVSSRRKRKYKVGQEMQVSYNPQNPSEAKNKSFMNDWIGPVVLVIVGVILVILGVVGEVD